MGSSNRGSPPSRKTYGQWQAGPGGTRDPELSQQGLPILPSSLPRCDSLAPQVFDNRGAPHPGSSAVKKAPWKPEVSSPRSPLSSRKSRSKAVVCKGAPGIPNTYSHQTLETCPYRPGSSLSASSGLREDRNRGSAPPPPPFSIREGGCALGSYSILRRLSENQKPALPESRVPGAEGPTALGWAQKAQGRRGTNSVLHSLLPHPRPACLALGTRPSPQTVCGMGAWKWWDTLLLPTSMGPCSRLRLPVKFTRA